MSNLRCKGYCYGFTGLHIHAQGLVQCNIQLIHLCRFSAGANILSTFIFCEGMGAICQQNRDCSGTGGTIPFYPKIIGLPRSQGIGNLKLAVSTAVVIRRKPVPISIVDITKGTPAAGGSEDIRMGILRHKGNLHRFPRCHIHVQPLAQRNRWCHLSTCSANILSIFILSAGMLAIHQQHRDRSTTAGRIKFCSKIIDLPRSQGIGNLKLVVSTAVIIRYNTLPIGIIDITNGIPAAGGSEDILMGILRYEGEHYSFSCPNTYVQYLIQRYSISCLFSAVTDILSAFVLGVEMIAVICQRNRDYSATTGINPFYPKIIGLPRSQGVGNFKLTVPTAVVIRCKLVPVGIVDIAIGVPIASGFENILMGNLRRKGNSHCFSRCNFQTQGLSQSNVFFVPFRCLSASSANILPAFVLSVGVYAICQQHRDCSAIPGETPFYPKIVDLPGSQSISNLELVVSTAIIIGRKLISFSIIDVAVGIPTAGGSEDVLMGKFRRKGNYHGSCAPRHIHIQCLIQGYCILCRFSTAANILSAFVLCVEMRAAVCQRNRDCSGTGGIIPFYPKIVSPSRSQVISN